MSDISYIHKKNLFVNDKIYKKCIIPRGNLTEILYIKLYRYRAFSDTRNQKIVYCCQNMPQIQKLKGSLLGKLLLYKKNFLLFYLLEHEKRFLHVTFRTPGTVRCSI